MEKLLPINIKGVVVTGVSLKFGDELKWLAEVSLLMENDIRLTSIYIGNDTWDESRKAEFPIEGYELAGEIQKVVEVAVTRKLNSMNKMLTMEGKDGLH